MAAMRLCLPIAWKALVCGTVLFAATLPGSAKVPVTEDSAIDLVKRTSAAQMDSALPKRAFNAWVTEKFQGWAILWQMKDCGEAPPEGKNDKGGDELTCVQVDIMQPAQDANGVSSRGFHVLFLVGTQKKGLLPIPRFHSATEQDDNTSSPLRSLGEVEP
jgi:hypothetical protein